jgi:hypothetical protein
LIWTFFMSSTEKLPSFVAIGILASSSFVLPLIYL